MDENGKGYFFFAYFNFDYSDLDINTKKSIDSLVVNKKTNQIHFFFDGNEFYSINKFNNWTFE